MSKLTIPKLPTFVTKLPSNGKDVTYRAITVKEESFLLLAKEADSEEDVYTAVKNMVAACTNVKINELCILDLEWLFLKIRMKSVSDEIEMGYRCTKPKEDGKPCNTRFESIINLNDVEIAGSPKISVELEFPSGKYTLHFKQPLISQAKENDELKQLFSMLTMIDDPLNGIVTKDDISIQDFDEFVCTFSSKQMEKLNAAMKDIGTLYYKDIVVCPKCGNTSENIYKTMTDFFG